eukprot:Em0009g1151a
MESFVYEADSFQVTAEMKEQFERDGYVIIRSVLSDEELRRLKEALEHDDGIMKHSYVVGDDKGRCNRMCLWNHPGDDITGMVGRCEKVAGTMEKLLDGEVYHYHTKLMMKEARTGGAFVWHQDYGYWYKNGCLFPHMGTVFIAIDQSDTENGCLKVLKGSHAAGRIEHVMVGGQTGADLERVEHLQKVLPLVDVELSPGDALYFHCNLLHRSDANHSDRRRWAFLIAYNRASNNPVEVHHHPQYTPLIKYTSDQGGHDHHTPSTPLIKVGMTITPQYTSDQGGHDYHTPSTPLIKIQLGTPRSSWEHLDPAGNTKIQLGTSRSSWEHLDPAGNTKIQLGTPRSSWGHLAAGNTKIQLGTPRSSWEHLDPAGNT